jgi:hypothetical protein
MGCLFAASYLSLPFNWLELTVWLGAVAVMMSLFLNDLYFKKLPFVQIVILTILCSTFLWLTEANIEQKMYSFGLISHVWSLFLPALFGTIFALSRGKSIGGGDVLLGIPIAILLPYQCVLVVLLLASILAVVFYLPVIASKAMQSSNELLTTGLLRLKPRNDKGQGRDDAALNTKIPFGSFLIIATLIACWVVLRI